MLFLILAINFALTFLGGLVALRVSERQSAYVSAFSSGLLIAVAVVTLLPEAFGLEHTLDHLTSHHRGLLQSAGVGFLLFYLLDLAVPEKHEAGHEHHRHAPAAPRIVGVVGALMLCMHRGIDGLILATADGAGVLESVGLALVFHNFADGLTTVSMLLRDGQSRARALAFVGAAAIFPLFGAALASVWTLPLDLTAHSLAIVSGAFLYIGGSHLLVREHGANARYAPIVAIIGFVTVWLTSTFA